MDYPEAGTLKREFDEGASFGVVELMVFVCPRCGCAVINTEEHTRWHTMAAIGMG